MTQKIMINTDKTKKRRIFLKIIFNHKQSALSAFCLFVQICLWFSAFTQNIKYDQSDNAIETRLNIPVDVIFKQGVEVLGLK